MTTILTMDVNFKLIQKVKVPRAHKLEKEEIACQLHNSVEVINLCDYMYQSFRTAVNMNSPVTRKVLALHTFCDLDPFIDKVSEKEWNHELHVDTCTNWYNGWSPKNGTVDLLGLCSDQQLSFCTVLDRASFPHYDNTKIIKFGWELFILWVIWLISYGLSFSGFAINCH